jgi:DNA-binding GntR family transcriptional regulator
MPRSDRASAAQVLLPPADGPRSSAEKVANYIRTLIFNGHLQNGERIRQDELADALHVSRIPIREAIVALDREGWVTSEPHRGSFVNGFHRDGIEDHYELLGTLFGLAARRATQHATSDDIDRLVAQQRAVRAADDPDVFRHQNDALIDQMFTIADSPQLSAMRRVVTGVVQGNIFEVVPGTIPDQKRATARIVKAIAARDANKAADEWLKLVRRQGQHVVELLEERSLLKARQQTPRQ